MRQAAENEVIQMSKDNSIELWTTASAYLREDRTVNVRVTTFAKIADASYLESDVVSGANLHFTVDGFFEFVDRVIELRDKVTADLAEMTEVA